MQEEEKALKDNEGKNDAEDPKNKAFHNSKGDEHFNTEADHQSTISTKATTIRSRRSKAGGDPSASYDCNSSTDRWLT